MSEDSNDEIENDNKSSSLTHWQIGLISLAAVLLLLYFFRGYIWYLLGTSTSDTTGPEPEWLANFGYWKGPGFKTRWLKQPPVFTLW